VDEVLAPEALSERVYGFARTLATRSQLTLAVTKEIVDGRADGARFRRWQEESREEVAEGVAAFMERRSPIFPWNGITPER
jgi:enoyl-CoA hydratase/carnithine racemase